MCSMPTGHPSSHHPHEVHPPNRFLGRNLGNHVGTVPGGSLGALPAVAVCLSFIRLPTVAIRFSREQEGGFSQQMFALFDNEIFRIESLAGGDSWTIDRAAAAFEARAHV